jgi:peroxiredoxin
MHRGILPDRPQAWPPAPPLEVSAWLNTPTAISLSDLRGRVVVLHAFQMLCPACVSHGLPQAQQIHAAFDAADVAVIGLHTVFEHHAVMGADALRAFVHEYRLGFPIGIDAPSVDDPIPRTMAAYALRGTPSLMLIDRQGRLRLNHFGALDDLRAGALIGQLVAETDAPPHQASVASGAAAAAGCDASGCTPA